MNSSKKEEAIKQLNATAYKIWEEAAALLIKKR